MFSLEQEGSCLNGAQHGRHLVTTFIKGSMTSDHAMSLGYCIMHIAPEGWDYLSSYVPSSSGAAGGYQILPFSFVLPSILVRSHNRDGDSGNRISRPVC